jgi:cell division protein FtsN
VISGAALVLLASYAPQVFDETVVAIREEVAEPAPEIDFVFPDILANDTVTIDPEAYPASFPEEDEDATPTEFLIQAASLKNPAAASDLSARLAELGLKARYERVNVNSEIWYRVMVGPFRTRVEADRAMTELRKRDLGPRLIRLS